MIKIYSHPRSGTNFLAALVHKNIYPGRNLATRAGVVGHWADRAHVKANPHGQLFGGHGLPKRYRKVKLPKVYIYRDGRDVALSLWNSPHFTNPQWVKTMTFSQFIRTPLDWLNSPGDKHDSGLTVFQHWKRHIEAWSKSGAFMVCYEDLVSSAEPLIREIAQIAGVKHFKGYKPITRSAGWFPSKHRGWRKLFSQEDIDYFYEITGGCYGVRG